ncbi:hypothetical protein [Staphylococcus auricularis]|uniref:Lipoprotein n=1 Tax=Staphylococcus auricularis TaxID=29379 RepID=A0ABX5IFT5_9STAP|nr:hypothetical protein [Staphylococcus auricularis]MEB6570373.1 hypothetical protein [Staphylococcus auricularis]PTH19025.1 hypothetical protein BU607_02975 [Staphylococcus auricularis]PTH26342.1 hypothetical protein BU608_04725 [Staphylococcus auricularis]
MKRIAYYGSCILCLSVLLTGCNNDQEEQSSESKTAEKSEQKESTQQAHLNDDEKQEVKEELIKWMAKREAKDDRAVSNRYFNSGSFSNGDWYAGSPDGQIQVSNQGDPGPKAFDVHNVVGLVTYESNADVTGFDESAQSLTNIEGYEQVANMSAPITKYLFADNGKVYKCTFDKDSEETTLSSGFAPKDHTTKDPNLAPDRTFDEVKDKEITEHYHKLLDQYDK